MSEKKRLAFKVTDSNCFEVTSHKRDSTGSTRILRDGKDQRFYRVVWEECFGFIPPGMCVLHKCDNRNCINPEHLFLGTQADNIHDMVSKDRGAKAVHAKLTAAKVREARRRWKKGEGTVALSKRFGVTPGTMCPALYGRTWRWV